MPATKKPKKPARLDPALNAARMDFCRELPLVMHRAHELGLVETGHLLHHAVKRVGHETAGIIERIGWEET